MAETETILVRELECQSSFRAVLTDRVGTLREKDQYCLRVTWRDRRGPEMVHRNFRAEPWPRDAA